MTDTTSAVKGASWTPALVLHNLAGFAGSALQVYGVLYWGWDTFQILMLYWMETAVIGFWGLIRLAALPENLLGEMTVNGRVVPATNKLLLQLFVPFVGISMAAHLLILWAVFSGAWATVVHGPVSFVTVFVLHSGAWAPLLLALLAGGIGFLRAPRRDTFIFNRKKHVTSRPSPSLQPASAEAADGVGPAILGVLGRIVMMQVSVIIGGMLARSYGSSAPWLILIGLRMLFDIQRPQAAPAGAPHMAITSGNNSVSM